MIDMNDTIMATVTSVQDGINDCLVVGFAESDGSDGRFLLFQRLLAEPDEQNVRLGLDTYCITDEAHAVAYGGVLEAVRNKSTIRLVFNQDTQQELGLNSGDLVIELHVTDDEAQEASEALALVLTYGNEKHHPRILDLA